MVDLGPHQMKALKALGNGKILVGPVGSGKTRTAMAYYMFRVVRGSVSINDEQMVATAPKFKTPLYVITTAKVRNDLEWEGEAVLWGVYKDPSQTQFGLGIVVDSWNNIGKYTDVEGAFFVFDEQRLVGSGAWAKSFQKIAKKNQWILLTGTPGDQWLDYAQVFIANGFFPNITRFKEDHCVYHNFRGYPQLKMYIGESRLVRYRDQITVLMPFKRHTTRHDIKVPVEYDVKEYNWIWKNRFDVVNNKPYRSVSAVIRGLRHVVVRDKSRLDALNEIKQKHARLIVFYNMDYEREILIDYLVRNGFEWGEYSGNAHNPIPDGSNWLYIVQYTAGSEGWNCVRTNAVVFFSPNYAHRAMEQAHGRIDRMNTGYSDLYYFWLLSDSPIERRIMQCLDRKENFNEAVYAKEMGL